MMTNSIAHYKILEKLGARGMGEVYLAEDTRLGKPKAKSTVTRSTHPLGVSSSGATVI
jgi:serine/threonine protein kinase